VLAGPSGACLRGAILGFFVLGLVAPASLAGQQNVSQDSIQEQVNRLNAEAEQRFSQRDYPGAVEKFLSALRLEPQSPALLSNLGVAYHMEGRLADAVATLRRALEIDRDLVPANLILGLDLVRLGKPAEALAPLETVLKEQAGNRDAMFGLASAYLALGSFDGAAEVYRRAVALHPRDANAWYGMGICFEHLAENTTQKLSQMDPQSSYYRELTGEFLLRQGAEIDAEQAFRQALTEVRGGHDLDLRAALGFSLLRLGQFRQAESEFNSELKLRPGDPEAQLGLAATNLAQDRVPQAVDQLCSAYRTDRDFFMAYLGLATDALSSSSAVRAVQQLRGSSADCAQAVSILQKEISAPDAVVEDPHAFDSPRQTRSSSAPAEALSAAEAAAQSGHYTRCVAVLEAVPVSTASSPLSLARCALLSGRFYMALDAAERRLQRDPQDVAARYWEAEASKHLAQAAFSHAVLLDPGSWLGHILVADLYRQRKQWNAARSNYDAAARLKPSSPAPYLGLATIDWRLGQLAAAQSELRKVFELDPQNRQAEFEMGDIFVRQHRFAEAVPYLENVIANEPDLLVAHGDLGKCYASLGNVGGAIRELRRAGSVDRSGELHYLLYSLLKRAGRPRQAERALAESQKLRAKDLKNQQGRLQEALQAAQSKSGTPR
jgi:tetratricopeptide (TPR) repeat protein